jgi:glycosyltransferase involved in cell wall biosynthesis
VTIVHLVVPAGIDDPNRPSGGSVYDRRVGEGLTELGWTVHEHRDDLAAVLGGLPDRALVLLDGLVASGLPEVVVPEATRLRLVVLLHLPSGVSSLLARTTERAVLSAASAVVATSHWTGAWLLENYDLRVHVVEPGVDLADLAPGTPTGGGLVCVGAVTRPKGYDVLVEALGLLDDLAWQCTCVGALDLDPPFVAGLGRHDRLRFAGPLTRGGVADALHRADLLVSASRLETYGMVVTEALAHGLPVVATSTGGVPEALGRTVDGEQPGLLVPPGDAPALAAAIRRWLEDAAERERLRKAAQARRLTLTDWSHTAQRLAEVLA